MLLLETKSNTGFNEHHQLALRKPCVICSSAWPLRRLGFDATISSSEEAVGETFYIIEFGVSASDQVNLMLCLATAAPSLFGMPNLILQVNCPYCTLISHLVKTVVNSTNDLTKSHNEDGK